MQGPLGSARPVPSPRRGSRGRARFLPQDARLSFLLPTCFPDLCPRGGAGVYRQGDYYRYLAEFARRQEREQAAQLALEAYKASYKHAFSTLQPWHPTRLGLALNFSVYYHDVYGSPDRACHLAKHAFDEAVDAMHATPEHTFRDSLMILHLLRDDIILWSAEMLQDGTYLIRPEGKTVLTNACRGPGGGGSPKEVIACPTPCRFLAF
jgi:14-3-3 protein